MSKNPQQFSSMTSLQPSSQNSGTLLGCNSNTAAGPSGQAASQQQIQAAEAKKALLGKVNTSGSQGGGAAGGPPVVPLLDFSKLK